MLGIDSAVRVFEENFGRIRQIRSSYTAMDSGNDFTHTHTQTDTH